MATFDMSEVVGLAALLRAEPVKAAAVVHAATLEAGKVAQLGAQQDAPKDRPWLSVSGIKRRTRKLAWGSDATIYTVPDPEGNFTSLFIEYGTVHMPPQPFMGPQAVKAETTFPALVYAKVNPLG